MKTAIVTGASGGIGEQTARLLSASGYRVLAFYNSNKQAAECIQAELNAAGGDVHLFKADFSDVVIGLGGSSIKIGEFVNSVINFLIVAFVLFVVIKFVNSLHKKPEEPAEPEEPTTKVCPYCQSEISIKAVRCPHCTSKLEGFPEMKV